MPDPNTDKHARPVGDTRCCFIFPTGRRCAEFRATGHDALCVYHARREDDLTEREHRTPEAKAVVAQVLGTRESFKTATQVNEALAKLFALRARKLISHRDARLLTYMCQVMLFSLQGVRNDFTQTYELNQWEKLVERALRAHSANLPPLSQTNPSPQIIFRIPPSAASDAVIPRSADSSGTTRNLSSSVTNALEPGRPPGSALSPAEGPARASTQNVAPGLSPAGVSSGPDSDPLPPSSSLNRTCPERSRGKQKRRPLAKTGREFASRVFDDLAASRAARKKRTLAHFGESPEQIDSVEEPEVVQPEVEGESEPEEGVESAPAHW